MINVPLTSINSLEASPMPDCGVGIPKLVQTDMIYHCFSIIIS